MHNIFRPSEGFWSRIDNKFEVSPKILTDEKIDAQMQITSMHSYSKTKVLELTLTFRTTNLIGKCLIFIRFMLCTINIKLSG